MLHTITDIVLIAIIVYNIWTGWRRGLILSVFSIIALVIALVGANLVADTFHEEFTDIVDPFIGGVVDTFVNGELTETDENGSVVSVISDTDATVEQKHGIVLNVLLSLGLSEKEANSYTEEICSKLQQTGGSISAQVTETMTDAFTYAAVFIIAFFLLLIIFIAIGNLINLAFRIPGVRFVNEIGGGVFGLVRGLIIVMLIAWLMSFLGLVLPDGFIENSRVLAYFIDHNPMVDLLTKLTTK